MSWDPDDSTLAWACGPWAFRRARLVCAILGHRWKTSEALYGSDPYALSVIPWAGACERCGLTFGDETGTNIDAGEEPGTKEGETP